MIRYYISGKDDLNNVTLQPDVTGGSVPEFYTVNDQGCTLHDIQFTPYHSGRSGYENQTVTVRGVVTATAGAGNLGSVYIQQAGETQWAGMWLTGGTLTSNLHAGDLVGVTGVVEYKLTQDFRLRP